MKLGSKEADAAYDRWHDRQADEYFGANEVECPICGSDQEAMDELVRDAERYRWLREQHESHSPCSFVVFKPDSGVASEATLYPIRSIAGELDAAIDAAMKEGTPHPSEQPERVTPAAVSLVKRLRGLNTEYPPFGAAHEAADEIERLHQICRNAYEVWAGSEGIPEPETAPEAYLLQLLLQMRDEVKKGL